MSTTNGELIKTVEVNTEPKIKVSAAAIIVLSYVSGTTPKELFIAGLKYESGVGFSIMDGVPATLNISNLIAWAGGSKEMEKLLPESKIKTKMVQKIVELEKGNLILDLSSIKIDDVNNIVELEVKIPGISVTTGDLGLPNFNGLTFAIKEALLKVSREVHKVV